MNVLIKIRALLKSLQANLAKFELDLDDEAYSNPELWSLSADEWETFDNAYECHADSTFINPTSGLPMIGDSMVDSAGNPYGTCWF